MTVAVVGRLLALNEPFYFALASMAIGVHIFFIFLAKGLQSTALSMLELRAQKDVLFAELEEEKLISDDARRRAEGASMAKSRFLATMSHELRTPLNAIMGFSEVMKDEVLGTHANPVYREYAADIYESGRHLLHLISEILDLSRIEAERYELHEERAHLGDIAEDCHRLLKLRAQSKGLEIVEDFTADLPQVWVDPRSIRQICLNLMSNALKFTPKGGRITLTVAPTTDGGQLLSVRDTGPGIPEEEIPKVMQAFGQGSLAHETAEGGTGLGLPIVKSLIELHGGTFELRSELRKGTEVIVVVPKQRVLATMGPLQPLGGERHRQPDSSLRPQRQPRLRTAIQPTGMVAARTATIAQH
jgi:two-component system cell cycle sensor histidine kinase PleC